MYLKKVLTSIQKWALSKRKHFPQHNPKTPDVRVGGIDIVLEAFQGQPLDRDVGLRGHDVDILVIGHGPGQAEVGDLDQFFTRDQNISGGQIPKMKNWFEPWPCGSVGRACHFQ
jgi:hypothetical protein